MGGVCSTHGKKSLVVNTDRKRPFGALGANGPLVSILILNRVENVGKDYLSQHLMGFRECGNELSGSLRRGKCLRYLNKFGHFELNPWFLEMIS